LARVRAQRAHARDRLAEVGEDGRLGHRVHARQLARRGHKVPVINQE